MEVQMRQEVLKQNYEMLPPELIQCGKFCCWQFEERNEKKTKVPYSPLDGERAKSNDPSCFGTYEQALTMKECKSFSGIGIGIFEGICAIDLDHCMDEQGNLSSQAEEIVKLMNSYTEISPSGDGLHILFRVSDFSYDANKYYIMNHKSGIEVYVTGATNKYVTITGKCYGNLQTFGDRSIELQELLERFMLRADGKMKLENRARNAINAIKSPDVEELLESARNSKNGQAFSDLWNGNISGYLSHSEADMALCSHLAFWTGCDARLMDQMFRQSALMRPKWDSRRSGSTYGAKTIEQAICSCTERYTPKRKAVTPSSDDSLKENIATEKTIEFPTIKPLKAELNDLPVFPVQCLPDVLKNYVLAVSEHSQTAPDMAAVIGLGVLASCVQGKVQMEGTPGYTEQLSLYIVVIASPGERKSSVLKDMTGSIEAYEKYKNESRKSEIRENKRERERLKRQISSLEKSLEKRLDEKTEQMLIEKQEKLENLPELSEERYLADDCSIEALTSLLANNKGKMTIVSTEGGIFDIMAGRYSNKPNLDVWLKSHCGDTIRVDRLGREPEYIPNPALTAILSIQPVVLNEIMENSAMTGRGLIARFLYAIPQSKIGKRVFCTRPISEEVQSEYQKMIFQMMDIPETEEKQTIYLSEEALACIAEYFEAHEQFLSGEGQEIADWANKYIGSVLRIAALLHVAQNGIEDRELKIETLKNAIEIGKYFLAHARYAYALMGNDLTLKKAKFVLGKIKKQREKEMKRSDLFQQCRGKFFKKTEDILPILQLLEDHGYIRMIQPAYTGSGRPADVILIINEAIWKDDVEK